jgi:hypothetical protein
MDVMDGALARLEALLAERLDARAELKERVEFVAVEDAVSGLLWVCRVDPRCDDPEAVTPVFELFWSDEEERWLVCGPEESGWGFGEPTGSGGKDVESAFAAAEGLGLLWAGVDPDPGLDAAL